MKLDGGRKFQTKLLIYSVIVVLVLLLIVSGIGQRTVEYIWAGIRVEYYFRKYGLDKGPGAQYSKDKTEPLITTGAPAVPHLFRKMNKDNMDLIVHVLREIGKPAFQFLMRQLLSPRQVVREKAGRALLQLEFTKIFTVPDGGHAVETSATRDFRQEVIRFVNKERNIERLVDLLNKETNLFVRKAIITVLKYAHNYRAFEAVFNTLEKEKDDELLNIAILAVVDMAEHKDVTEKLCRILEDKNQPAKTRQYAAYGLVGSTDKRIAVPVLVKALKDESPEIRRGAACSLAVSREVSPLAVDALLAALNDPDREVRYWAAVAFARMEDFGDQEDKVVPVLEKALKDEEDKDIRMFIRLSLNRIAGKEVIDLEVDTE